ncbi:DUF6776 family protein [Algiphilus sp.]|uniref:DUF6776 family protein n=1 Tax=Algiphilus sp. TaxID=1872431 RepID=UPI0025BECDD3|nr:DUF6776 family protein [Algiphilus sp.]MCK5769787.1 hypothetical protein [Algiphilus sp.]
MAVPPNGPRIVTDHERRPRWIRWLVVTTLVVIALAGSYAVYVFVTDEFSARYQAMTGDRERLLALRRELAERLRAEQLESERLRERLAYLEKSQQIDREACQQLRQSLRDMQSRLVDAQEQLAFYRGIVSPENEGRGVRVHDFIVRPDRDPARFELVLVQGRQQKDRVRGHFTIDIAGERDGESATVAVRNAEGETDMLFSFRHFQEFSGSVTFPDGFEPEQVAIVVQREGEDQSTETRYEWQRVVAGKES